ncbi:MAG: DUF4384 domain-containing protein [Urechidicola sp.]|nr:DUF4384 domain-containing protein [Urechidicola sp.]
MELINIMAQLSKICSFIIIVFLLSSCSQSANIKEAVKITPVNQISKGLDDSNIYSYSHLFDNSISEQEACKTAERELKQQQIEDQCGVQDIESVSVLAFFNNDKQFYNFMRERITGEIAVFDKQSNWSIDRITPNRLKCTVEAKIEVTCHARDASFAPLFAEGVTLNKSNFIEGDSLKIKVESENNLYFYLFQYSPGLTNTKGNNKNFVRLFPNQLDADNYFKKGSYKIPSNNKYDLLLTLGVDEISTNELIVALALRKEVPFKDIMTFTEFNKILSGIKLINRREAHIPYSVNKR